MPHLLVTNDFPPKVGGIQSYLWELYRRAPHGEASVLTTGQPNSAAFDEAAANTLPIHRVRPSILWPTPAVRRAIHEYARDIDADFVMLDPVLPVGWLGPSLDLPYGVVLHGAEVSLPARVPGVRAAMRRIIGGAELVVAAGNWVLDQAQALCGGELPSVVIPPGVDTECFHPQDRTMARQRLGLPADALIVASISRLVPRKGMHLLIPAIERLSATHPNLCLVIAGTGREAMRLQRDAMRANAQVIMMGAVPQGDLPALYASADLFAMLCHDRWWGLEAEGFGIVFLEAAACGVPQLAGRSGGSVEAVLDGTTGRVVANPRDATEVVEALAGMVEDASLRDRYAAASRQRALEAFDYEFLSKQLFEAVAHVRS